MRYVWDIARVLSLLLALAMPALAAQIAEPRPQAGQTASVSIVKQAEGYRLLVNGQALRIRGAGLENGSLEQLAARGGNALRTWRVDTRRERGKSLLDRALANHLFVAIGIEVARERHGFDYNDERAVAKQLKRIRKQVRAHRDHPALLLWVIGNELNLESSNPRVWNAVNEIAEMIKQEDPRHPVMTTLAGFDPRVVAEVKARAPALDLLGIQLYGDISGLAHKLAASAWDGPYVITEWGPTGHWEVAKTAWGAPIEDSSSRKAERLVERYQQHIASDTRQGLGSFVFLWGQKQERTATWYGMFLSSGEATAAVDAMQFLWTGAWPANRSPSISPLRIEAKLAEASIRLRRRENYAAEIDAADADDDPLQYYWEVFAESRATEVGGDPEKLPAAIRVAIQSTAGEGRIRFNAPARAGAYRLVVTVRDGQGHAAHANIPFLVD